MNSLTKATLIVLALSTAACTNPNRFGGDSVDLNGSAGGFGPLGSVDDPTSPAFFNERIGDRVLFAVDESTLSAEAKIVLDGQISWLMENPDYAAVIEGHADEQGTREYNLALGARRANAVREYLITGGVAAARIQTVSYGKERPISVCSEEACYAQNRRAVTVISIAALG